MRIITMLFAVSMLLTTQNTFANEETRSELDPKVVKVEGTKYPNSPLEGEEAISFKSNAVVGVNPGGFDMLLPFALRSPDQQEAGSCLYMANTGIAEWWLARLNPEVSRQPEGPLDLSERHLMNLAGIEESGNGMENWKTDSIYLFNDNRNLGVLNSSYRFTQGWYKWVGDSDLIKSTPDEEGAEYGTYYNWIDEMDQSKFDYVQLPSFERDVIFADPESNQWNVGVMPGDITSQVKKALRTKKAPVQVVYNHFGYWHAVMILGYNDSMTSDNCSFVQRSREHFPKKVIDYKKELETTTAQEAREKLIKRIKKTEGIVTDLEAAWKRGGGCKNEGVFYVRDSIYPDANGPMYDYDQSKTEDDSPYSMQIITHEYEWVEYLSNHLTQVYIK